jgi:hypothetical protein
MVDKKEQEPPFKEVQEFLVQTLAAMPKILEQDVKGKYALSTDDVLEPKLTEYDDSSCPICTCIVEDPR